LLLGSVIVGILSFGQYGVAWDESAQRTVGLTSWNYVFNCDNALLDFIDRDYGVAFEFPLILFEKIFGLVDVHSVFLMRHLAAHLFFLLGAFFCYRLIDLLYQNKALSVIGFFLFILHPHIYAHSFFNTKDVPFLVMFTICFYVTARFFRNKTWLSAVGLGACLGLLINMRIMGVLLLCCVLFFLALDAVREKRVTFHLKTGGLILLSCCVVLYATWPYLWKDPFVNFHTAFKNMSYFRWELTNLFNGKKILATKIAWYYLPVWFCITTPIPYLLAGVGGIITLFVLFVKKPMRFFTELQGKCNLIFLMCFFAPLLAVIILRSVLYDGWRQMFFIYPSFILLLIFGLHLAWHRFKKIAAALATLSFLLASVFMISNAPFQHTYFNEFVSLHRDPEYLRKHYEMDYWGTSFKQSLEYILESDPSPVVYVCTEIHPGFLNAEVLPAAQRSRVRMVRMDEATYFMTNYRWHPEDYPFEEKKVHAIKVLGSTINAVYKLK
jgi:hypothetical protein